MILVMNKCAQVQFHSRLMLKYKLSDKLFYYSNVIMDKRCQLIRPYVSNTIYEFPTLIECAKRCCTDIENNFIAEGLLTVTSFTLKDIDTKKIFTFNMNTPLNKSPQTEQGLLLMGDVENNKIHNLEQKINKLEDDISKIKQILIIERYNKQLQKQQFHQDGCTIQ